MSNSYLWRSTLAVEHVTHSEGVGGVVSGHLFIPGVCLQTYQPLPPLTQQSMDTQPPHASPHIFCHMEH